MSVFVCLALVKASRTSAAMPITIALFNSFARPPAPTGPKCCTVAQNAESTGFACAASALAVNLVIPLPCPMQNTEQRVAVFERGAADRYHRRQDLTLANSAGSAPTSAPSTPSLAWTSPPVSGASAKPTPIEARSAASFAVEPKDEVPTAVRGQRLPSSQPRTAIVRHTD